MRARHLSMHAEGPWRSQLTRRRSKTFLLDQQTHPSAFTSTKAFGRRHSARPNHFSCAFKNWPTDALVTGDSLYQEHLLELSALPVAARSVGIARPPTP